MGYHEIEVKTAFDVTCQNCKFVTREFSAGAAETKAREHIEDTDGDNYSHVVSIDASTYIGRQI